MIPISANDIILASGILVSRLTRPSTVNVTVLYSHLLEPSFRFDKEYGRYVGIFSVSHLGKPCFFLASRSNPIAKFDHLFVYYMNQNHEPIQDREFDLLKRYLPYADRENKVVKVGIINVQCLLHPVTYLSILIEAVDYTIGQGLFYDYKPVQALRVDMTKLIIGTKDCNLSHCDGVLTNEKRREILRLADQFALTVDFCRPDERPYDPDLIVYAARDHLIGIIISKEYQVINYIVTHRDQFVDETQYAT